MRNRHGCIRCPEGTDTGAPMARRYIPKGPQASTRGCLNNMKDDGIKTDNKKNTTLTRNRWAINNTKSNVYLVFVPGNFYL